MEQQPPLNYLWFAALVLFAGLGLRKAHKKASDWLLPLNSALCIYFILAYYFEKLVHAAGAALFPLALLSAGYTFWHSLKGLKPAFQIGSRKMIWLELFSSIYELLLFGAAFCAGFTEGLRFYGV